MNKKWVSILGVSMLIIGLSACSDSNDNQDKNQEMNGQQSDSADQQGTSKNSKVTDGKEANQERNDDENKSIEVIDEDSSITALVNKEYSLSDDYQPDDLVTIEVPAVLENPEVNQLRKEAAEALKSMFEEAKESGINLYARSGYRSYETQVQLFESYMSEHGEAAANRYSAKPGHSEHQTGLVMDVTSESVDYQLVEGFGETPEGKWISEHAHEFGFIIRYPKGAEDITGYIYEPWHIRYLGADVATEVYKSGLTYEEYLVEEGIIHEVNS